MKSVIRNCNHGSDLVVAAMCDPHGRCQTFVKSSSTVRGRQGIGNEWAAYEWYNQQLNKPIATRRAQACQYLRIEIAHIDGVKVDYRRGLLPYQTEIAQAIQHYCAVWNCDRHASRATACSHGDLSLENIIFSDAGVRFIDWEHFRQATLPLGFDGLYLLFVSLFFEIQTTRLPTTEMLQCMVKNIAYLKKEGCLDASFEQSPLAQVVAQIRAHRDIWDLPAHHLPGKLPILQWSDERVRAIDEALSRVATMRIA